MALGSRCVLAASFGNIFYSNCFQNGLLPVVLPESTVQALEMQTSTSERPMTIDLVRQLVISPAGEELFFEIDKQRREALLEGLDDIDRTLKHASAITAWQAADRVSRPWGWQTVTHPQMNE